MQLNFQSIGTYVQNAAAAAQAACSQLLDFTTGSVALALTQSWASIASWLQWLIFLVLQTTRLATSSGSDVDSFIADFGLTRPQAVPATGTVTLSRYSPTVAATIAPGVQVKTTDGTQTFTVIADTTQPLWSASANAYVIPAGTASGNVTVQAVNAGTQGNVAAGTITLIASSLAYIDSPCTNPNPFTNGVDAATDAATQALFQSYIQTRARATNAAIQYAVAAAGANLTCLVSENVNTSNVFTPGYFVVTVNDGTGSPGSSVLNAVAAQIEQYRPVGAQYAVVAPPNTTATVSLTLTTNPSSNKPTVTPLVQNAIKAYIASLGIGQSLSYGKLFAVAFGADPSVSDITGLTLNGGTADLAPAAFNGLVVPGTVTVA